MSKVYFIGAGPGDPELLTLKGARILSEADVIIYAGSLVNPEVLKHARPDAIIYDSAKMTLKEALEIIRAGVAESKTVARLHTGDPSIYGAVREQAIALEQEGIDYEIVPGVSSAFAAAAALRREFTLPGTTQTVIFTRAEGRTAVPEAEKLAALAKHRATTVIFLSVQQIEGVVESLLQGYSPSTPVAVVYKASWPEQRVLTGTLSTITQQVRGSGITRTALIIVGEALTATPEASRLYDEYFSHGYREAKNKQ